MLDDVDMLNLKSKRPHIPHRRDGDGRLQKEVDDICPHWRLVAVSPFPATIVAEAIVAVFGDSRQCGHWTGLYC